jgi:uncharacterized protein with FMN-binding domain
MKLLQTAKACVLSLAIMPLAGAALDFDLSRWIVLISAAAMLSAIGIFVGVQTLRSRREYHLPPPEPSAGDRVSNRLVVLSSAAVLAVYGAGYFRTRAAADQLAARVARQVAARTAPIVAPAPPPAPAASSEVPQASPRPRKKNASGDSAPTSTSDGSSYGIGTPAPTPPSASNDSASNDEQATADSFSPADYRPGVPLRDGRYQGRGTSPHGDIIAEVVIQKGHIAYAGIADCLTRYSCSVIKHLPQQVVERQSIEVDLVSGASESASAFQDGIAAALARSQAVSRAQ